MYTSLDELQQAISETLHFDNDTYSVTHEEKIRSTLIDPLVFTAMFAESATLKTQARAIIRHLAAALGIRSSSLHAYYLAIGAGMLPASCTVPAINLRTMTYDMARLLFKLKQEYHIGPLVMELARSEMLYTHQRYDDFAIAVLAAAIKEGYRGPVFLQADHVQVNASLYRQDSEQELQATKRLIAEAIDADFRNIDIDASPLVDLSQPRLDEQQRLNYTVTAALTRYIRARDAQVTLSVGGEIGHIGGKNSTPEELIAFLQRLAKFLSQ